MNTSSFSSNPNASLLSLNSSQDVCCAHQAQYQSLYQDLSSLRMEHRTLKHENAALKNTTRGLEEQNALLKQFLASKKEMVTRLNHELEQSQREIDRLEDQLQVKGEECQGYEQKVVEAEEELQRMRAQSRDRQGKEQELERRSRDIKGELERLKYEYQRKIEQCNKEKSEEVQSIRVSLQHIIRSVIHKRGILVSQKGPQEKGAITGNQASGTNPPDGLAQINFAGRSPLKHTLKDTRQITPNDAQLCVQVTELITHFKQQEKQFAQLLSQKQEQVFQLETSLSGLQTQLASSLELLQEKSKETDQLRRKVREIEEKLENLNSRTEEDERGKDRVWNNLAKTMGKIIKDSIPDSDSVIEKILSLCLTQPKVQRMGNETNSSKTASGTFECEILLHELQTIASLSHSQSLKASLHSRQLERLTLDYSELKQSYELLTLKYNTLHREYNHILEDNNRLIKFNALSKYRVSRNFREGILFSASSKANRDERCSIKERGTVGNWDLGKENMEPNSYDL